MENLIADIIVVMLQDFLIEKVSSDDIVHFVPPPNNFYVYNEITNTFLSPNQEKTYQLNDD